MNKNLMVFAFAILIGSAGCYYDNQAELFPADNSCDTSGTITYNSDIKPILSGYCGSENSCHNSANATNNFIGLYDYASVSGIDSAQLVGAIEHDPNYKPMPKGGGQLSNCRITLIKKWIQQGKPQQ